MGKLQVYFYIQLKRVFKILPTLLLSTMLVYGCMGLLTMVFMKNGAAAQDRKKYQVGIVGDISDTYLGFGIHAIKSLDDSRFLVDFDFVTEEEAQKGLRQGRITAYVRIPDGLVDSLVSGRNDCSITYIAAEGQKGISSILMEELAAEVSTMITRSQSAIYGMQKILFDNNKGDIWVEATDKLNLRLIQMVLKRTDLCGTEILGVSNGLSVEAFYFCSIMLFFILLSGISSSSLFCHKSRELSKLLAARNVGAYRQVAGEYLAYLCLMMCCTIEIFLALSIVLSGSFIQIPEWRDMGAEPLFGFFVRLLPVIGMVAAMQFLLYELVTGVVNSILLQFISSISMAYLSGYFYPERVFPDVIKQLGEVLPTGIILRYISKSLIGEVSLTALSGVCLYLLLFLGLSVFVRKKRIQKG